MSWRKRVLRSEAVRRPACWLVAQYIRLCRATGRWRTVGAEIPDAFWQHGRPFILAFWHGRLMMMPVCWPPGLPMHVLISQHADGELIARSIGRLGISSVRGSSARGDRAKGGVAALRTLARLLARGESVAISPDGPRGPRMRVGGAVTAIARLSGAPVVPVGWATSRRLLLDTWDRFAVPLPFAAGVFVWGEPIEVPSKADPEEMETARRRIEAALNAVTAEADRLVAQAPVEPAPLDAAQP